MSYVKISGEERAPLLVRNFLARIRKLRTDKQETDDEYVRHFIADLLSVPVYHDQRLLQQATKYLMDLVEERAPNADGVAIPMLIYDGSPMPGGDKLNRLYVIRTTDTILSKSPRFIEAFKDYCRTNFTILMESVATRTGIPVRASWENGDDNGMALRFSEGFFYIDVWWFKWDGK